MPGPQKTGLITGHNNHQSWGLMEFTGSLPLSQTSYCFLFFQLRFITQLEKKASMCRLCVCLHFETGELFSCFPVRRAQMFTPATLLGLQCTFSVHSTTLQVHSTSVWVVVISAYGLWVLSKAITQIGAVPVTGTPVGSRTDHTVFLLCLLIHGSLIARQQISETHFIASLISSLGNRIGPACHQ